MNFYFLVFDFNYSGKNLKEKEIKRQTLSQLVEFVGSANGKFSENLIQEVTRMVGINILGELVSAPSESKLFEVFIVDVDVEED